MLFLTGFPGFLGAALLPRALARARGAPEAVCLVQRKFAALARERVEAVAARHGLAQDAVRLVEGDITQPDLGLSGERAALLGRVTQIYHLAAVYDLAVGREVANLINVEGTKNVLAFASACARLERLHYASTCYVSGRHPGVFSETQLEAGQRFNNPYEESKYLAEVLVREAIARGMPATIYRPSIVVGDSRTGATQKYDGPYHTIRWMLRQPRVAIMPLPAGGSTTRLNLVPCDYVVNAIDYLASRVDSVGATYHLADPDPLTIGGVARLFGTGANRRVITVPVPLALARAALSVPGAARLSPIPAAMLDYVVHPTRYDTAATRAALEGSGLACPRLADYAARLVEFVQSHPSVSAEAMV